MSELFITFEGGEGVGKTTQIRLLANRLENAGYTVCCLREPGGTAIGEQIREVLLDRANTAMAPVAELLLYEAARAQLVEEVIRPALERGEVVLIDRFYDSSTAYQAYARGLGRELVDKANEIGSNGLTPTRTILLTKDVDEGLRDATKEGADRLELEGHEFHEKVHRAFDELAQLYPERIVKVACETLKADTHNAVFAAVADMFNEAAAAPYEITGVLLDKIKESK